MWYPSPSAEADNETEAEADDEAKAEAEADILVGAEFKSDGSPGYVTTDLEDDRLHGYAMPVL